MKKSVKISIIAVSILAIVAGTSIGLIYAFSPSEDSTLAIEEVTTYSEEDLITVKIKCEEENTGTGNNHQNKFKRSFAYMHQFEFKNSETDETMHQEQLRNQWRNRIQEGNTYTYQFHVEGLEQGQMLQLRITYNNGQYIDHYFEVDN